MKHRAVVLALASASIALPSSAHAADDLCSRLIIQAVNQFCQLLPNGLNLCQPVALVGPNPQCNTAGSQAPVPVPLGPATLQPLAPWAAPYASQWPATQAAAHIPLATRATVAAPARPIAPTPPEAPHITAEVPKPVAAAMPATPIAPAIAPTITPITTVAAPPPAPVAVVTAVPAEMAAPSAVAPITAAPSEVPAPVVAASAAPVAKAPIASAAPVVEPLPTALPVAVATPEAVATPPAIAPPAAPEATLPATAQTIAAEAAAVDALAHFDFDSATLTPVGRAVLDAWLSEAPKDKTVRVSGYADRLGPEPYNLKLSLRRAEAVKQYLAGKGFDPRRIQLEAKGEAEPVKRCKGDATAATKACLAPNRRVRIDAE
ncbi:MAG: OmpA family protein [Gallionellaceae bacterium]|nr:OmpA family protein [Gallionellaceae bacterium]